MTLTFTEWLRTSYVPIAGAEAQEAPAAETDDGGGEGEAGGFDTSALESRMDEVLNRVGGIEERWDTAAQQAQYAQQPEQGFEQPQFGTPEDEPGQFQQGYGDEIDPTDPAVAQQIIQQEVQRGVQQALAPEFERQSMQRRTSESEELLEDYPELNEPQAASGLISDATQWANDITQDIARGNPQLAQALVQEPAFLELIHLAAKAAESAENEATPTQQQDGGSVDLEGGAPSNPGGGDANPQPLGEQIKQAGSHNGFWM